MTNLLDFLYFSLAAGAGAFSRFTCSVMVEQKIQTLFLAKHSQGSPASHTSKVFPWGVFVVNMLGCLGFGLAWGLSQSHFPLNPTIKTYLFTGFFGAFTTFSTYIFELYILWQTRQYTAFLFFSLGQILLGLWLTFMGIHIFS